MTRTAQEKRTSSKNGIIRSEYTPIKLSFLIVKPKDGLDLSLCPIIFLHGLMESKEVWINVAQSICDQTKRKAYIFDARNHGDSEWTDDFTMNLLVEDLNYFMDTNSISKAVLIGYSMGGYAASRLVLKHPEKVELVVIEEAPLDKYPKYFIEASIKLLLLWANAVSNAPTDSSKKEAIRFAVDYMFNQVPPPIQKKIGVKENLYDCNYAIKLNNGCYELQVNIPPIVKSAEDWENSSPLEGVFEGQACFIYGRSSTLKVKNYEKIWLHFPNAVLKLVDGASHNVHMDQPEKYKDIVLSFLLRNQKAKY